MPPAFVVLMFLVCGVESEVGLTVTPKVVVPLVSPEFSLECRIDSNDLDRVVSISISRLTIVAKKNNFSARELIVEMRGPAPVRYIVGPGFENSVYHGKLPLTKAAVERRAEELNSQRSNLSEIEWLEALEKHVLNDRSGSGESYLNVKLRQPRFQDLGVYTCDVNALEENTTRVMSAEATVSTQEYPLDMLLAVVWEIQETTLKAVLSDIGGIKTAVEDVLRARNETCVQTPARSVNEIKTLLNETSTDEAATDNQGGEEWSVNKTSGHQVDQWTGNKTVNDAQVQEWPVNNTSNGQG